MNKKPTFLSVFVLAALYHQTAHADLRTQCLAGVPHFSGEVVRENVNDLPIFIEADQADIIQPTRALYQGEVDLRQGNRQLQANEVEVKQVNGDRLAEVRGGFHYHDNLIYLNGQTAQFDLTNKAGSATQADYQFVDRQGRGTAQTLTMNNAYRVMENATFTSCLPDDNAWQIQAAQVKQHIAEEYAEMWHARFKVAGVPIFYTPYLQFPIGDRRRSGLLMPSAGSSSRDGYWYEQPIYWNIAPNYDATFVPKYMSHRGWQMNGEFRYLTPIGEGKLAGEYLNRDRYEKYRSEDRTRHLFYWNHNSAFLQNWRLNIDYTRVSDKRYFTDFDSPYGSSTDGYANQYARIAYYQPNYNFAISARQFQIFDEVDVGPYRAMPQIDFNYYQNDLLNGWVDFKLFSQAVRFANDSNLMPTAWRFHLEPSLSSAMANRYGSIHFETKLYATHYDQRKGTSANAESVQKSVNRVLPQVKIDLQTVLATHDSVINGYTQTLEPHVQYLFRPYKNQSNIGSSRVNDYLGFGYDSALVQQDYYSLFRDRRYSGLDRIASANQITVGGTTRFYDKNANERFNFSAGQIYYLTDSKIDNNPNNKTPNSSSSWALEANWKLNSQWNWHGSYQYDTKTNRAALANASLEFNPSRNNLVQLNYRYASQTYIDQNLGAAANRYGQDIKQIGIVAAWAVSDNWSLVGKYYQDIALKKPVEQYAGVQYNACCWSAGIGMRRYVTSRQNQTQNDIFYDHSVGFTFELRGLNPNDHANGIQDMLKKGKLPYLQTFSM